MPIRRDDAPLIVTARLDEASFVTLDGLRRRHFPTDLDMVPAHVSLFHKLPGAEVDRIRDDTRRVCRARSRFELEPVAVRFLGRGVAIDYEGEGMHALRGALARTWSAWLTPQDTQPFKPHVTIQNKVTPERARALRDALALDDVPVCQVEGVTIWRYLGGPWEHVESLAFVPSGSSQ